MSKQAPGTTVSKHDENKVNWQPLITTLQALRKKALKQHLLTEQEKNTFVDTRNQLLALCSESNGDMHYAKNGGPVMMALRDSAPLWRKINQERKEAARDEEEATAEKDTAAQATADGGGDKTVEAAARATEVIAAGTGNPDETRNATPNKAQTAFFRKGILENRKKRQASQKAKTEPLTNNINAFMTSHPTLDEQQNADKDAIVLFMQNREKLRDVYGQIYSTQGRGSRITNITSEDISFVPEDSQICLDSSSQAYNAYALKFRLEKSQQGRRVSGASAFTVTGAVIMLSSLGALAPQLTTLIAANPELGGAILAIILVLGALLIAGSAVHIHAARTEYTVTVGNPLLGTYTKADTSEDASKVLGTEQ